MAFPGSDRRAVDHRDLGVTLSVVAPDSGVPGPGGPSDSRPNPELTPEVPNSGDLTMAAVLARMDARLARLPSDSHLRIFLSTYRRTTLAVADTLDSGLFEDPAWVERWDVVFADLYLHALDAHLDGVDAEVSRPWRLAFGAPPALPPLRHVLLGINAHVNYDLPQALLAAISVPDFADPALLDSRRRDHAAINTVLSGRVGAEDIALGGVRSALDRVLQPLNRQGSRRFLAEARAKVWANAEELHAARIDGPQPYRTRLGELEVLSTAKVADLLAPGQVILRLAVAGFGVTLPPR